MCGRMVLTRSHDEVARLFRAAPDNDLPELPNWNVCPTNQVPVVTAEEGGRRLRSMRWGLVPRWYETPSGGPLLINARSETVAEKPAFREAVRERRCLIASTGFYEWDRSDPKKPLPWYVTRADGEPLVLACIWQEWHPKGSDDRQATVAVLTCEANEQMSAIHDRLPVILDPADWPLWLGEEGKGAARLMRPIEDGALRMHRVGTAVNSNRARGEELIEVLEDDPPLDPDAPPVNPA